jgi:biopolymer transport protein ExbD/biopolymer transport protein TolR
MASSLKLDLPRSDAAQPSVAPAYLVLAISSDGALFLGDEPIERDMLAVRLADAARGSSELEVQLRADRSVAYGRVAELIGVLQQAGLNRIAFVAEPGRP